MNEETTVNAKPSTLVEVTGKLVNKKMHMISSADERDPIHTDYFPPYGDSQGYMPLQVFLISLATCASGAVLVLLGKMQKAVNGLEVKAIGNRREQHPTCFSEIMLEFVIRSADVTEADMDRVISLSEEQICPVWAMIKGNVKVETSYRILR